MVILGLILSVILGFFLWAAYHKIFDVTYFGAGSFFKEIWIFFIIGYVIINYVIFN